MSINAQAAALRQAALQMIGKKPPPVVNAAIAKANVAITAANSHNQALAQSYAAVGKHALQQKPMDQIQISGKKS
jgi:hypothetical protein